LGVGKWCDVRLSPQLPFLPPEHFHKSCSDELDILWTAVFLAFGFHLRQGYGGQGVSAQLQGCHGTCAFAEALPKSEPDWPFKNPRGSSLQLFCQCSIPNTETAAHFFP
jgi:hypothetical protein